MENDKPPSSAAAEILQRPRGAIDCELLEGEVVPLRKKDPEAANASLTLRYHLVRYVEETKLGTVHGDEERFLIDRDPDTLLACDCAFVRAGRVPQARPDGFLPLCPDLAVETVDPQAQPRELETRAGQWLHRGCRAVWMLDPRRWRVTCHAPESDPRELSPGDTLRGGEAVPGFHLDVARIFGFLSPRALLVIGVPVEASLAAVALLLGFLLLGTPFPFALRFELRALWLLVAATLPMVLFALLGTSSVGLRFSPLRGIHDRLRRILGPTIYAMKTWQFALLSLAAGVGEEALFRGVLQARFGIWVTSVAFGLLHALTPAYFVLAFAMSVYLGWLHDIADHNLLVPIGVHAIYDAVALCLFRKRFRESAGPELGRVRPR